MAARRVAEPEAIVSAEDQVLIGIEHGRLGQALAELSPELRGAIEATALDGLTPVPAWVTPAGYLLRPPPSWPRQAGGNCASWTTACRRAPSPAVYPLIAQLTGWCAVTVTIAACAQRSRNVNLGGAVAAAVSFAAITLSWFLPATGKWLNEPPVPPLPRPHWS